MLRIYDLPSLSSALVDDFLPVSFLANFFLFSCSRILLIIALIFHLIWQSQKAPLEWIPPFKNSVSRKHTIPQPRWGITKQTWDVAAWGHNWQCQNKHWQFSGSDTQNMGITSKRPQQWNCTIVLQLRRKGTTSPQALHTKKWQGDI